jgi:hypothetical protein
LAHLAVVEQTPCGRVVRLKPPVHGAAHALHAVIVYSGTKWVLLLPACVAASSPAAVCTQPTAAGEGHRQAQRRHGRQLLLHRLRVAIIPSCVCRPEL